MRASEQIINQHYLVAVKAAQQAMHRLEVDGTMEPTERLLRVAVSMLDAQVALLTMHAPGDGEAAVTPEQVKTFLGNVARLYWEEDGNGKG